MPIRKRISDPDGPEAKEFARWRKYGALPTAPRKPGLEERKPLIDALERLPVGEAFYAKVWSARWITPYIQQRYKLWGIDLAVYPSATTLVNGDSLCVGALLTSLTRDKHGTQKNLMLRSDDRVRWYRLILEWLDAVHYGGV